MRHIIVEGPDGAGKSMLVGRLSDALGLSVNVPFSRSLTGPVDNLRERTAEDLSRWPLDTVPRIYDRYPIISEPIYGPTVRGEAKPGFTPGWVNTCRLLMYPRCVVVWCMPTLELVTYNVQSTEANQMPGVATHIPTIYAQYQHTIRVWTGISYRWNYQASDINTLVIQLKGAIQ